METLKIERKAKLIHGITGVAVTECTLPAGTEYESEGYSLTGSEYLLVAGYRYELEKLS